MFDDAEDPELFDAATAGAEWFMEEDPDPAVVERNGSRTMPHPETGRPTRFVRASSFGGHVSDKYNLMEWNLAMVALGMGRNRGLTAISNATPIPKENMEHREQGWWKPWSEIAHDAIDSAQAKSGAHLGTAVHAWVEQVESGELPLKSIPREFRAHVIAHMRIHEELGIRYVPEYREQLVVNMAVAGGVSGRLDALRLDKLGRLIVDDTKTGRNAPLGLDEIAIQLAVYANATHMYAPYLPESVNGYVPMPGNIRKDVAMVSWVPINDPDRAQVIPVDIKWGWRAAQIVGVIRAYQNRAKRVQGSAKGSLWLDTSVLSGPTDYSPLGRIDKP